MNTRIAIFVGLLFVVVPTIANGQCVARHGFTGQLVNVVEQQGWTVGNAYAIANWAPNGWPVITYGPRMNNLNPLLQSFIKVHECAHLSTPTMDEVQANCIALTTMRQRGLSRRDEDQIANWTAAEGVIGMQYGGTGIEYWRRTLVCAGPR